MKGSIMQSTIDSIRKIFTDHVDLLSRTTGGNKKVVSELEDRQTVALFELQKHLDEASERDKGYY
jgi:hypothetical protein